MKNEAKFMEYMTCLGEIHEKKITDSLKDIYWKTLEPFSDEACEMAFNRLISTCKFFPKPAEFIEILAGNKEDNAVLAWQKVMDCLSAGKKSSDLTIERTVRVLGGWDNLGLQSYDELKWTEKRFKEHYEVVEKRREIELLSLSGIERKTLAFRRRL